MNVLRLISRTKLYWGLIAIFLIGVLGSPVSSKGNNIFLSYGNLLDVLRQVSITGLIATGMTAVIITGGIDLSVGSLMAICSVVCAMLLTVEGDTPAVAFGLPMAGGSSGKRMGAGGAGLRASARIGNKRAAARDSGCRVGAGGCVSAPLRRRLFL